MSDGGFRGGIDNAEDMKRWDFRAFDADIELSTVHEFINSFRSRLLDISPPGCRWPFGMRQSRRNRRFRRPPRHWNPEPKFGLRLALSRLQHLDAVSYIRVSDVKEMLDLSKRAQPSRHARPMTDDDYIIFANKEDTDALD